MEKAIVNSLKQNEVINSNTIEMKLKNFLNLYWLRPENGLLCTLKSKVFEDIKFEPPSLDISCGDGLFMFLHQGGVFDSDFDYFQSTKAKNFKHTSFVDIYDSYRESEYEVKITKRPGMSIDYGTDWKQALLDKASKLDLYKNLLLHDNNVTPLPVPDNYFNTIYSNSVYWVKNVKNLLTDIYRMIGNNGIAALELMTPFLLETLDEMEGYLSRKGIDILNRKRRETMPGCLGFYEWKKLILECSFKIEEVKCVYPNKILIDIWNIGLRPIAHLLIQMADALSVEERIRIKQEWVEIFFELFKPLLSIKQTYSLERAPYLLFVLKK